MCRDAGWKDRVKSNSGTKLFVAVVIILLLIILGSIYFFKNKNTPDSNIVAYVNGKAIKQVDYQLRLRDASLVLPGQGAENLKQRVLVDMINAELLFQEAVRRYGELPKNAAIKKIMKEEVESPVAKTNKGKPKIDIKRAELEVYGKFVSRLRAIAKIELVNEK